MIFPSDRLLQVFSEAMGFESLFRVPEEDLVSVLTLAGGGVYPEAESVGCVCQATLLRDAVS